MKKNFVFPAIEYRKTENMISGISTIPPSVNHAYMRIERKGIPVVILTEESRSYKQKLIRQLKRDIPFGDDFQPLSRKWLITGTVFYKTMRSDIDNFKKLFYDALFEAIGGNDNLLFFESWRKDIDKDNPRIVFELIPLEEPWPTLHMPDHAERVMIVTPIPPSVNHMYNGTKLTQKAKDFKDYVSLLMSEKRALIRDYDKRYYSIVGDVYFNRHNADLDNIKKALYDAVFYALGCPDSRILFECFKKHIDTTNPRVELYLQPLEEERIC